MKYFSICILSICFFSNQLFSQTIDHWETVVFAEDIWKYRVGDSEPPSDWFQTNFDDSSWEEGQGGIGYNDGDDNTTIQNTISLYLRMDFDIVDISQLELVLFHADYDDGFIAYLNGVEIARANMDGDFPPFDAITPVDREAQMYNGGLPVSFTLSKDKINQCLQNGNNTLAIQVHNRGINSSDLSSLFFFSVGVNQPVMNYSPTPTWFTTPFSSSDLPIIKINTFGEQIPDDPKIVAHMGIIDNGPGNRNYIYSDSLNDYDGQIAIETRGASSANFPKKNYGFETQNSLGENNNVNLLGMPKENDWILHGPFSDKSLIRNVLAFHLGNLTDRWAPRTRYCELFINDEYIGIYILMEKIKRDDDRVDIAKLDFDDNAGDSLTGGYIVQVDRFELGNGWNSPFDPNHFFVYQYPNSDNLTTTQENYIKNHITNFEQVLAGGNFADPDEGYQSWIDVGSFIDHLLVVELSRDVDAYRLSSFLFKDKDSKGGLLNAGPLWDFNLGFGNADYCDGWETSGWNFDDPNCGNDQPFWWDRLQEDPTFNDQVQCRWDELRAGPWHTDSIMQFIDNQAVILDEAQVRNFERWQILGNYLWPNAFVGDTYEEEITYLKNWTTDRLIWMDENMIGVCTPVATTDLEKNISFTVQPNPFSETINFIFEKNNSIENGTIKIYDALGKEIRIFNFSNQNKVAWDGKNGNGKEVATGIYFYTFSNKKNIIQSGKIIKM
jgi:hypothetical protein